ncbi:MAG: deoxynucleoside kinase [Bacteroidales bacterium]|jgi:deoxyadenosine/deoxycytidine kinase|nr:deoxynucleoside kinase [Bacteroidales bacterium]MDD2569491.1 deoxynucleoside kinase [Bacteroidales bacterium]MDD2813008.1 deoxynucleoside kinase [Bacteroidales bacterium]MDD3384557.1 deoxynucleoside kinase [Bacteroidales bacterium]MDD3811190.1 deoxynucleoside kinase [Bacteroidales bacterium]
MEIREKYPTPYRFLVIEGNIGAGKTSLAERISRDYRSRLILERFADNPFLPKFYQDQERYAFPVEMAFLADRYNQLKKELQEPDIFAPMITADYYFMKSLIFAANTLAGDEYNLYSQLFHIIYASLPKPDLYVYLHQEPQNLINQIWRRGREYESAITVDYLRKIQNGYFDFFRQENNLRILIMDVRELDFVQNQEHYLILIDKIFGHTYPLGVTRVIP